MDIQGFKVTAKFQDSVKGFPFDKKDTSYHNKFKVSVSKDGVRRSFDFYDSAYNNEQGIEVLDSDSLKESLRTFLEDALSGKQTFEDFCDELGYDTDSLSANHIWEACQKTAKKVEGFGLSEDETIELLNSLDN